LPARSGSEPSFTGEAFGAQPLGQLGREHLHDDAPAKCKLLRHEYARHATAAELALEDVRVREVGLEVGEQVGHRVQHTRGTLGVNAVAGGCRLDRRFVPRHRAEGGRHGQHCGRQESITDAPGTGHAEPDGDSS